MRTPAPLNALMNDADATSMVNATTWRQWFSSFTDYYERVLKYTDPSNKDFGKTTPPSTPGLMAWANGTDWNPGGGKGMYYYDGAAWVKM